MTIKELNEQNKKFQKGAGQLSEWTPSGGLTNASAQIIRSAGRIQSYFEKLLCHETDSQFGKTIDQMENHMDEMVFILDQMDIVNRGKDIRWISDFLKDGYNLLSVYSMWIDQLIKDRIHNEK